MPNTPEYILGTDPVELARLRFQHKVWIREMYALFRSAGLRAGDTVLDLGCGPGSTTLELATAVGPAARGIAVDESEPFLAYLAAECERYGLRNVEPVHSRVEAIEVEPASVDFAYARWLFCWLKEPEPAMARAAVALRPGACLALQEYVSWGSMGVFPESEPVMEAIAACRRSWDFGGGDIDIARRLPEMAPRLGLTLERFVPHARLGAVGSLEWQWVGGFLREYLPKVAEMGLYDTAAYTRFLSEWERLETEGHAHIYTPVMSEAVLRKR